MHNYITKYCAVQEKKKKGAVLLAAALIQPQKTPVLRSKHFCLSSAHPPSVAVYCGGREACSRLYVALRRSKLWKAGGGWTEAHRNFFILTFSVYLCHSVAYISVLSATCGEYYLNCRVILVRMCTQMELFRVMNRAVLEPARNSCGVLNASITAYDFPISHG